VFPGKEKGVAGMRDNVDMAMLPLRFVRREELDQEVKKCVDKLPAEEVVRVRYSLGEDWSGDPAIYFRIVLTDEASREKRLGDVAQRIEEKIDSEVQPYQNWGLLPYFSFRSASEQAGRHEPEWS
jgi:hypothetical protein